VRIGSGKEGAGLEPVEHPADKTAEQRSLLDNPYLAQLYFPVLLVILLPIVFPVYDFDIFHAVSMIGAPRTFLPRECG
jgi:hypothetical protein